MRELIVLILLNVLLYQSYGQTNDLIAKKLTSDLEQIHSQNHIVGFSVAVYNDKGTLYEKGFGYSNKREKKDYTQYTLQNIGSISKTFIGISLLKAQELGKLNLDDPINNYLPFEVINPYYPNDNITIRQIASHTSSIRDRGWWYDLNTYILKEKKKYAEKKKIYFRNPNQMISMTEYFENYLVKGHKSYKKKNFSNNKPGQDYEYSNIAATLGAYILEQATGEDYKSFTQRHIFSPLKMTNTGWSFNDINFDNHSMLYTKSGKRLAFYSLITYPDGGLITSSNDMAKYGSELIKGYFDQGIILTPKSYKEAFIGTLNKSSDDNYRVFFDITNKNQIGHGGSDPGIITLMYFDYKEKVGRYLQINTDISEKNLITFRVIWEKLREYQTQFK